MLSAGTGARPKPSEQVVVRYRGTLIDGTMFDETKAAGPPATFAVSQVIVGFGEGLELMKVGGKWRLFIPAKLGYGAHGVPDRIPPDAVLIFEVELLGIKPPLAQPRF